MTAAELTAKLTNAYPLNATCWSQATDEVRDMSRIARETLELGDDAAVNFRALGTPAKWNATGVHSIVAFFKRMDARQQAYFLTRIEGMY